MDKYFRAVFTLFTGPALDYFFAGVLCLSCAGFAAWLKFGSASQEKKNILMGFFIGFTILAVIAYNSLSYVTMLRSLK